MAEKRGFVPVVFLVVAAVLLSIPLLDFKVTSKAGQGANIRGVLIAREGSESSDETAESSGGLSGSGTSGSGGSGGNRTLTPATVAPEEIDEEEDEVEDELEDELDNLEEEDVEIRNVGGRLEVETEASGGGKQKFARNRLKFRHQLAEVEMEATESGVRLRTRTAEAATRFPLSFNPTTGELFVNTGNGLRQIRILPDQAAQRAREAGIQTQIDRIELVSASATAATQSAVFRVTGRRAVSFLGIIPLTAEVETEVSADNGEVLTVTQPAWLRLLAAFLQ